ncbi:MAG: FtsK/SpoIIIE domain-containing protein [Micrococcaceae bacterium]
MTEQYSTNSESDITIYSYATQKLSGATNNLINRLNLLPDKSTSSLFCVTGPNAGLVIPIRKAVSIGRSSHCDIQIADVHTPRIALKISIENARYYFEVISSTVIVRFPENTESRTFVCGSKYTLTNGISFIIGANTFYIQNSWEKIKLNQLPKLPKESKETQNYRLLYAFAALAAAITTTLLFHSIVFLILTSITLVTTCFIYFYEKHQNAKLAKSASKGFNCYRPLELFQKQNILPRTIIAYGYTKTHTLTIPNDCTTLFLSAKLPNLVGVLCWLLLTWAPQQNSKVHIHGSTFAWIKLCYRENIYLQKYLKLCSAKQCKANAPSIDIGNYHNKNPSAKYFSIPTNLNARDIIACDISYFLQFVSSYKQHQLNYGNYQDKILLKKPWQFFLGCDLKTGKAIWLDLNVAGPHFAIAGTTGSGKSELLNAALLSLCLNHKPRELALFICDFKGGTSLKLLEELPHTVFAMNNQNLLEAKRALNLLVAEINRRESIFGKNKVKNLEEYCCLNPRTTIPKLIVVIDEFRILVEELPDELPILVRSVSVGRSMGIHVIFASQNMQGILSAAIRSNIGSFISLKAKNIQDSIDIIQTPDAAEIVDPGQGILVDNAGNQRLFQTLLINPEYPDKIQLETLISYGALKSLTLTKTLQIPQAPKFEVLPYFVGIKSLALFPPPLPKQLILTAKEKLPKNSIYLGKIDFPNIKTQENLYWNYQKHPKLVIAGENSLEQSCFIAATIKQLLMSDKPCALIGKNDQIKITDTTPNHQKLIFSDTVTEVETLLLLLKEPDLCLIITDWDSLWRLVKSTDLTAFHTFEMFLLASQNIVLVCTNANFFSNPLAKYFTAKLVMPFYDKASQTLAECNSDSFRHFPKGRARAYNELNPQQLQNTVQLIQTKQSTGIAITPPLKPLPHKVNNGVIYGLAQQKLIWNTNKQKTLLISAEKAQKLESLVLTIIETVEKDHIYFFDCSECTELTFPSNCEVLVIEYIDNISTNADNKLLRILKEQQIAVCATGLSHNLTSCFNKSYQKLKAACHGIIFNPKSALDGIAIIEKINTMPSNINNRGVYFHPEYGEVIVQA